MMEERISMMATLEIHTAEPFNRLFPIKESVLNEIVEDMRLRGYDYGHPVIIWAGHKVTVVDGHTRLAAALKLGMSKIPILLKEFADEDAALQYAIRSQSHRRNLTDAELLTCLGELDKRRSVGRPSKKIPSREGISGESAEKTADLLGISRAKVERLRAVNDHASDKVKTAVKNGEMSVHKAYKAAMEKHREESCGNAPQSEKSLEEIRADRKKALVKNILTFVKARFERENHEYPDLRYTLAEKNNLDDIISSGIGKLIETMIPGENR